MIGRLPLSFAPPRSLVTRATPRPGIGLADPGNELSARGLAVRAEVRRAAGKLDLLHLSAAAAAGLSGPAVNQRLVLIAAVDAVAVPVVTDGRAAELDRPAQNQADLFCQTIELGGFQLAGGLRRVDAGLEQRLVGVDIPDAGDQGLIEQGRFDGLPAIAECLLQVAPSKPCQRLRPELGQPGDHLL